MFAVFGIILLVAGAILAFAVERQADGFDLVAIGWILMLGGGISLLAALVQGAGWMTMRRTRFHAERQVSPDGKFVVEDVQAQ